MQLSNDPNRGPVIKRDLLQSADLNKHGNIQRISERTAQLQIQRGDISYAGKNESMITSGPTREEIIASRTDTKAIQRISREINPKIIQGIQPKIMTVKKQGANELITSSEGISKTGATTVGYTPSKRSSVPVSQLLESGITSDNEDMENMQRNMPSTPV